MTIIFQIDGGLGKSIMATAVLSALRKQHPKDYIIVVSSYPTVFSNNPKVNRVLRHDQLTGIYKNHIESKDCKILVQDPYQTSDFLLSKKHLIQIWCEQFGIPYNGELPEFFLLDAEREYFAPFYKTPKPILAIQPNGGAANQPIKYSWTRDIPQPAIEQVIQRFKNDYTIVHIKRPDQLGYADTLAATDEIRSIAVLLEMSKKRLLIDSSSMHLAAALGLPSIVFWSTTSDSVFGYEMNKNVYAAPPTREVNFEHPFYQKHLLFEELNTFPYNNLNEVVDANLLIKALSK